MFYVCSSQPIYFCSNLHDRNGQELNIMENHAWKSSREKV